MPEAADRSAGAAGQAGGAGQPEAAGKPGPTQDLIPLVYEELRAIAHGYFRRQPASFTLRPTEIVNEACIHLLRHGPAEWDSPQHFRAIASRKIWQVIIDHLKHRHAQKRGGAGIPRQHSGAPVADTATAAHADSSASDPTQSGLVTTGNGAAHTANQRAGARPTPGHRVPLDAVSIEWCDQVVDLLDLADALEALAAESRRLHDVVMLHWFGGLTHAEVAGVLGVSTSTAEKDFRYALAWLNRQLAGGPADEH